MIARTISAAVGRLAKGSPVVLITGPRQSGKTTLARASFGRHTYLSMEDPDTRARFRYDPRAFLAELARGAVIDEFQVEPDLASYLQGEVDRDARAGRFVLTGSQQLEVMGRVRQSLAGRVARVELLPFSYSELHAAKRAPASVDEAMFRGGYPPLYARDVEPTRWLADYVATYVQRDVRAIVNVRDLGTFTDFVRLCAVHAGQLVNLSQLGEAVGVDHKTVRQWLTVLEASYVCFLLRPHHRNLKKRLVKSPKLYFYDTGLAAYLLGVRDADQLRHHPSRGALFENWVIVEWMKAQLGLAKPADAWFWRNASGLEVDLVLEVAGKLRPIEIKSSSTFSPAMLKALGTWSELAGAHAVRGALVYAGDESRSLGDVDLVAWRDVVSLSPPSKR